MFSGFEVRVGEAEEDVSQLAAGEEVGEEFHRVGPEGGDVLVGGGGGDWIRWGHVRVSGRGRDSVGRSRG